MAFDISRFDFIDFGASTGGMITNAQHVFEAGEGLGIDLSEKKVAKMREFGFECVQGDITLKQFPKDCVRFVTMSHILEHLPSLDMVQKAVANAALYARDFLYIQGPFFDADDMLADLGLKLYWSDWHGHPLHLTIGQLRTTLRFLGLENKASFFVRKRIRNSFDSAVHPLSSPSDQHGWQEGVHPPKPFFLFEKPVWSEFACFIPLREGLEIGPDIFQKLRYERLWQPSKRRQIVVLGMHRSGTSCLSGLLKHSGAYFAQQEESIGQSAQNPKGFFERRDLRITCDFALQASGADWNHVHAFSTSELSPELADACQARFLNIFKELDSKGAWFIKEPRLCLLLPLIHGLLDEPVYIIIYRDPIEVAESLQKRNQIPIKVGLALWEKYMTEALNQTNKKPRVLVHFKSIIENPEEYFGKVLQDLKSVGVDKLEMPMSKTIQDFVDPSLRHYSIDKNQWCNFLTSHQQDLAQSLIDGVALDGRTWALSSHAASTLKNYDTNVEVLLAEVVELKQQRISALEAYERQQAVAMHKDQQIEKLKKKIHSLEINLQREKQLRLEITNTLKWRFAIFLERSFAKVVPRPVSRALYSGAKALLDPKILLPNTLHRLGEGFERLNLKNASTQSKASLLPIVNNDVPVDIVVCVHNSPEDVANCLKSFIENRSSAHRLIVVDDGSDIETVKIINSFLVGSANDILIRNDQAIGYTKAANRGLRAATAKYCVLLNSDTILTKDWLGKLVAVAEQDSNLGILGPLSNAASWQSVPDVFRDGDWAVNDIPAGLSIREMGRLLERHGEATICPSILINGFCMLIRMEIFKTIGYFDETHFPFGYGEETDLCLRANAQGYSAAIVTSAYVFHAKSRSFSHERRRKLSYAGNIQLKELHGQERIDRAKSDLKRNIPLSKIRDHVSSTLQDFSSQKFPTILFLLPCIPGGGGVHSVMQEALAMHNYGAHVRVAIQHHRAKDFCDHYSHNYASLLYPYIDDNDLINEASKNSIAIATIYTSVSLLKKITNKNKHILPFYYAQDYEPLFHSPFSKGWRAASSSYTALPEMTIFAKTDWIRNQIETNHGVMVHRVQASLDHSIYKPLAKQPNDGVVRIAAMVRPQTPRRNPQFTFNILKNIQRTFGTRVCINIFGAPDQELAEHGLICDKINNFGRLTREGVAEVLGSSDIFIDLSEYQAFGRTALESMACGCAAIVPLKGGATEFANDGINSFVVDTANEQECLYKLSQLIENDELRKSFQKEGLRTASEYSIEDAAISELMLFLAVQQRGRLS